MKLSKVNKTLDMNTTLQHRLTQFWQHIQISLFPLLEEIELVLTPKLQELVTALEMMKIERFLNVTRFGAIGRPCKDRTAIARAFVAKAVLNLPTTEALIDRLKSDINLRRICGFSSTHAIADKSRFSRAFAEFAQSRLPERVHAALIAEHLGDQIIGHISHDSTAIMARERPKYDAATSVTPITTPAPTKKRGRPRKDAPVVITDKVPTRIERQQTQSLAAMLSDLPHACDIGTKLDSKGHKTSWQGYKLHVDTADGDIPVSCILSSASLHDSQVMMPLMTMSSTKLQYLYDLADAAYCSPLLRAASRHFGHVPLIDHNPRRGEKIEFEPHEAVRYKERSSAERLNAHLKDHHGGRQVWVRGSKKVMAHLMFGIIVITSEQLLRLLI
jgi:hypothetical protein